MSREEPRPAPPPGGLCPRCAHVRRIESSRGTVFLLCRLSRDDPAFPKYPQQPVVACRGFRP